MFLRLMDEKYRDACEAARIRLCGDPVDPAYLAGFWKGCDAAWELLNRKHVYWNAGEPDCPRDIKASNGELHALRCKVCGQDGSQGICTGSN